MNVDPKFRPVPLSHDGGVKRAFSTRFCQTFAWCDATGLIFGSFSESQCPPPLSLPPFPPRCLQLPQATTALARCCCLPSRIRWCPTWTWAASHAPSCSSSTSCTAAGSGGTEPSSPTSSWRLWKASSRRPSTPTSEPANNWPARSTCGKRKWRWVSLSLLELRVCSKMSPNASQKLLLMTTVHPFTSEGLDPFTHAPFDTMERLK